MIIVIVVDPKARDADLDLHRLGDGRKNEEALSGIDAGKAFRLRLCDKIIRVLDRRCGAAWAPHKVEWLGLQSLSPYAASDQARP